MKTITSIFTVFIIMLLICSTESYSANINTKKRISNKNMVLIPGGKFKPLYSQTGKNGEISVKPYYISKFSVTNAEFLEFVKQNPKWRRSNVKSLFADKCYLKNWRGDLELGNNVNPSGPVTYVSWFAAKAYCEFYGLRLPTSEEWEFAALAGKNTPNGLKDEYYLKQLQDWYSQPAKYSMSKVGSKPANYWGIYDMHGLIWEWTQDFYSNLITGESRNGGSFDKNLFCGSGAIGATDFKDYAAFMRYAFRSSLKANYTIMNLGFRCARDA